MTIVQCANCQKDINLKTDAQTSCAICEKDFCFAMSSTCFSDYHKKNQLIDGHSALSISNPSWIINLISNKENNV